MTPASSRHRVVNLVVVALAVVVSVTAVVLAVVTGAGAPSSRDRMIAATRIDEADLTAVLPTESEIRTLLATETATQSAVTTTRDLDGVIVSSVAPENCRAVLFLAPSPTLARNIDGWAIAGNTMQAVAVAADAFANRTTATASFDSFVVALRACPQVEYRSTLNTVVITDSYTAHQAIEASGIPYVEWQTRTSFTAAGVAVSRTAVSRAYLLGNAVFRVSYAHESSATGPEWASRWFTDFETKLRARVDGT